MIYISISKIVDDRNKVIYLKALEVICQRDRQPVSINIRPDPAKACQSLDLVFTARTFPVM